MGTSVGHNLQPGPLDTGPTAGHSSQHVFVGLLLGREKRDGEKDQGGSQMDAKWEVGEGP